MGIEDKTNLLGWRYLGDGEQPIGRLGFIGSGSRKCEQEPARREACQ